MRAGVLPNMRCPADGGELEASEVVESGGEITSAMLSCACGERFEVEDGITDFMYPRQLEAPDQMMKDEFDGRAHRYDSDMVWQFEVFSEDKEKLRRGMIDQLELAPGMTVLETGAGTGEDSHHILDDIGASGTFCAQDISAPMLELAREKLATYDTEVDYHAGNASYLPFEDGYFDAAFHFGALNNFAEPRRALEEMTRVVNTGGKVVIGDEGMAPWLRRRLYGKIMIRTNQLYKHRPPLEMLPVDVRDVSIRWLLGDAFYVIEYRVGEGNLPMDLDLPMPRKGDTLRSRYYGTKS